MGAWSYLPYFPTWSFYTYPRGTFVNPYWSFFTNRYADCVLVYLTGLPFGC